MPKTTNPKRVKQEIVIFDWHNKYDKSWNRLLVPDAFQHPAKISFALAEAIYDFAIEQGILHQGDTIVDPFAGIAGTALSALLRGMNWRGVELESKFVALGNADIELWNARFGLLPKWGSASIVQGDSRNLAQIVMGAECAVTSPPYADAIKGTGAETAKQRIADGKYTGLRPDVWTSSGNIAGSTYGNGYSMDERNLGNLREGDFAAAVTSPPYSESLQSTGNGIDWSKLSDGGKKKTASREHLGTEYGVSDGQLGAMKEGEFDAAVSSPPFGAAQTGGGISAAMRGEGNYALTTRLPGSAYQPSEHGADARNLGNLGDGETFWLASRQIVAQLYQVLKTDGYAFFVVKDFARTKRIVPFCEQWMKLCESVGFETTHWIRAWQVKELGTQLAFDGNHQTKRVERKSFFRRLHEKKNPGTRIDYEVIIVMRKV